MMALEYPRDVFARHPAISALPDAAVRRRYLDILDVVFFASMLPEEGEAVRIGVVVDDAANIERVVDAGQSTSRAEDPQRSWFVIRLEPIGLTPVALKRLARGTEYGRDLIVVGHQDNRLVIRGLARRRVGSNGGDLLRVAAPRPGELILEGVNRQLLRYLVGTEQAVEPDLFEDDSGPVREALRKNGLDGHRWILAEALRFSRASRSGAMYLCLAGRAPPEIRSGIRYRFSEPATIQQLERLRREQSVRDAADAQLDGPRDVVGQAQADTTRGEVQAAVEMLGQLSAIDGAVVIEPGFIVLGAGFIIPTGSDPLPGPTHCIDAAATNRAPRAISGGSRRAAGFRFAWMNPGAVVFIVSSDGPVTCALRRGEELLTWLVRMPET